MKTKRMSRAGMMRVVVLGVLCAGSPLFAAAPVLYDNFNTATLGSPPPGWTCVAPTNTSCAVSNFAGDRAVVITDNTTTSACSIAKTFAARTSAFSARWRFKVAQTGHGSRFVLYSGGTGAIDLRLFLNTSNVLCLMTNMSSNTWMPVVTNLQDATWYDLQVVADPATDQFAIYANGVLQAQGLPFTTPVSTIDKIYFASANLTNDTLYIDNVVVDQTEYYVAPTGNDANPGTSDLPFATIARARDVMRTLSPWATTNLTVWLRGGVYAQTNTLAFSPADSGCNGHQIIYKAYPGEEPVISGGLRVTGPWTSQGGGLYWTSLPASWTNYFRHLYVNGLGKQRAATEQPLKMKGLYASGGITNGVIVSTASLPVLSNPAGAVLKIAEEFHFHYILINGFVDLGDGRTAITLQSPGEDIFKLQKGQPACVEGGEAFFLENDINLCDKPGEWFYDKGSKKLYYRPEAGEDITTAEVYAPLLDKLMTVYGTATTNKVAGLCFEGLTFAHATWARAEAEGIVGAEGTWIHHPDTLDVPRAGSNTAFQAAVVPAAICLNYAQEIEFHNNTFRNLGAVALGGYEGVIDGVIEGNVFYDIGNAALHFGHTTQAYLDEPEEETCKRISVRNNAISHIGVTDWGAPGFNTGFVEAIDFSHNDLSFISFDGVKLGESLSKYPDATTAHDNRCTDNKIRDALMVTRDGGSIYTQARNEGTVISGNHLIACNNDMGIYLDLGSGGYLVCSNVVERPYRFWLFVNNGGFPNNITNVIKDNFATTNHYYVGVLNENIVMINNTTLSGTWPAAAVAITNHAGLEPSFANILAKIPVAAIAARYAVNPANLTVTAPANTNIALGQKLCLKPVVTYPTLLNRPVYSVWSKVSGPTGGEVAFNAGAFADAEVRFGVPGTYVLQVTAGPGVRTPLDTYLIDAARSRSATTTVTVTGTVQTWQTDNVALNQPATATEACGPGYGPEKAVDGAKNTLWCSVYSTVVCPWWQVDLGSARVVRRIEDIARAGAESYYQRCHFRILASTTPDFSSYVVLAQQNGSPYSYQGCWLEHLTNGTAFRYLRRESLALKSGGLYPGGDGMGEFRVFVLPPPGLAPIGNKTNNTGSLVTFTAAITNADPYMTYSYTLGTGAPANASLDSVTGVFTWTPPLTQVPGDYAITVRVTDSGGQYSEQTVNVTVKAPGLELLLDMNAINAGIVQDGSGSNRHGTVTNNPALVSGISDHALQFNGNTQYVATVAFASPTNALTVACWAKSATASWNTAGMLISKRGAFILHPSGGKTVAFYCSIGGLFTNVLFTPSIDITQWHHYAGIYDGSYLRLYIDGTEVTNSPQTGVIIPDASGKLYVGSDDGYTNRYFKGAIDEVRVYSRALSTNEIVQLVAQSAESLDAVWSTTNIGSQVEGFVVQSNTLFQVAGSGTNITGSADQFRLVYQSASGDCTNIARVVSVQNTSTNARAGVMIRESLTADSKQASLVLTPSSNVIFSCRSTTGGSCTTVTNTGCAPPQWLKVARSNNVFQAYRSSNGTSWTQVGSDQTITMNTATYIGLMTTSLTNGVLCNGMIDNVTITP